MFIETLLPPLPLSILEIVIHIVAFLGIILISYGVFLETERRQDLVFALGGISLCVYAIYIANLMFVIAMGIFALNALIKFIEILVGIHRHDPRLLGELRKLK